MSLMAVVVYGAMLLALAMGAHAWGRWQAVLWPGVVPWAALSLAADAAWAATALGVAARRVRDRTRVD